MQYSWKYNPKKSTLKLVKNDEEIANFLVSNKYRSVCEIGSENYFFKSDGKTSKSIKVSDNNGEIVADIRFGKLLNEAQIWYNNNLYILDVGMHFLSAKWSISHSNVSVLSGNRQTGFMGIMDKVDDDLLLTSIGLYAYLHYYESNVMYFVLFLSICIMPIMIFILNHFIK